MRQRDTALTGPVKALYLALALTALALACFAWNAFTSMHQINDVYRRDLRIQELRGRIAYLDEARTSSARLAALTGDPDWEPRYRSLVPDLAQTSEEAFKLAPADLPADTIARTRNANDALLMMEERAFDHLREQRFFEARAVLFG